MRTQVINAHKTLIPKNSVFIGRPSKWGNPFIIGLHGNRVTVIKKYEDWIRTQPQLMNSLQELKGRILICYCKPQPCHGDVLVKLIKEIYGAE